MRERERLAKIYQTWLVKIAKMGGSGGMSLEELWIELQWAISEGGKIGGGGRWTPARKFIPCYPRQTRSKCTRDNTLPLANP
jgi:hypothetical protein